MTAHRTVHACVVALLTTCASVAVSTAVAAPPTIENLSPTNITATSATLNGNLLSDGGTATAVRIYWGATDGGTVETNWANVTNLGVRSVGPFSASAFSLQPSTLYYYRCRASNAAGVAWAPESAMFATPLADSPSNTHYVSAASTMPAAPYTTWLTAARTIQAAIDTAEPGDTVLVTNGTYNTGGAVVAGTLTNRIAVLEAVEVRSVEGAAQTLIVGRGVGPGSTNAGDGAVRCAYLGDGARLVGFTLTNGHTRAANGSADEQMGGGVICPVSADILDCVIVGNAAYRIGGGICNAGGAGNIVYSSEIRNNRAEWGGGMAYGNAQSCSIRQNTASMYGGGIGSGQAQNCVISSNVAGAYGGGANNSGLTGCLVTGNRGAQGGGVAQSMVENCTIVGNTTAGEGGGAWNTEVRNSIVWSNTASVSNNCFAGTIRYSCTAPYPAGTGNVAGDPLFVDAAKGDYRLRQGSPCINTGQNQPWMPDATDLDGHPRIFGLAVDVGAYEWTPLPVPPGLAGWWPGDGHFLDISGNRNDGASAGAVSFARGKVSDSFHFDGTPNSVVNVRTNASLGFSSAVTLAAWVKHDALGGEIQRYIVFAIEKAQLRYDPTAGGFSFIVRTGGSYHRIEPNIAPEVGRYYHVAGTYDGTTQALYLDGNLVASQPVSGALEEVNSSWVAVFLSLSTQPMRGIVDEAMLFNRALSSGEIAAIHAAGTAGMLRPLQVLVPPASAVAHVGMSNATMRVVASGVGALTYQWRRNGLALAGKTNAVLVFSGLTAQDVGTWNVDVVVSDGTGGSVTSAPPATLTVEHVTPVIDNASGATSIGPRSAQLNGNLVSTGTTVTAVSVFWGAVDRGTNGTAWANRIDLGTRAPGPFSTNTYNLTPDTFCYYRCRASNAAGAAWAPATASFRTLAIHTITANAGSGGRVIPSGAIPVVHGAGTQVAVQPDAGYHIADVRVDGASVGPVTNVPFVNVTTNHVLLATFAADQPVASFVAAPVTGSVPLTVVFTNLSHPMIVITNAQWDFQNDGVVDRTNPQDPIVWTYDLPGQYSVRLRVAGPGGAHTLVRTNYVGAAPPPTNRAPTVCVAAQQIFLASLGDMATLDAACSGDPDGDTLRFSWREYYENPYLGLIPVGSENLPRLNLYLPSPGRYRFDVRVSDGVFPSAQIRSITVYVPGLRGVVELSASDGAVHIPDARVAVYANLTDAQNRANPVDTAIADSLGQYTLGNLSPLNSTTARNYFWQVERPSFVTSEVQMVTIRPDPGYGDFTYTLPIGRDAVPALRGSVLQTNGLPIQGAIVAAIGIGGQPRVSSTDASGRFSLSAIPYGSWMLQFVRSGYQQEVRDVNVGPGTTNLVVHLAPGTGRCTLAGRVASIGSGRGLAGAKVNLGQGGASVLTDADGRYAFSDLPLGRTTLSVEKEGFRTVRVPLVSLTAGENALDVRVTFARSGPILFGSISDGISGLPVPRATVGVADASGLLVLSDVTDCTGYFQMVGVPAGSNQTLRVAAAGYRAREARFSIASYAQVNLALERAANWRRPATGSGAPGLPRAQVAQERIALANLGGSALLDGRPSTGNSLRYVWRELPNNPVLNLIPAGSETMASIQVSGFTRPGIYVFELQVRSGPVLSPNVATITVSAPGLTGNVHASPSDGAFGLPLATVRAYTNYALAAAWQLPYLDSKQTRDDPPGDFALDQVGTGTCWVVAQGQTGQGYKRYGPVRARVNYATSARAVAINLAAAEYRFQGRITDPVSGAPIENVQVVLTTGVETEMHRTTTDVSGRFCLYAVPGGSHPVMLLKDGFKATTSYVSLSEDMTADYTLERNVAGQLAALAGTINANFKGVLLPVPGAEVTIAGGLMRTHTDGDGRYRFDGLPPGVYYGTIRKAGYRPGKLSDLGSGLVTLDAGVVNEINRTLAFGEHGPVIRGIVIDEAGQPVSGATATVLNPSVKAPMAAALPGPSGQSAQHALYGDVEGRPPCRPSAVSPPGLYESQAAPSDAAGIFQLDGVPDGRRLIRVQYPDGRAVTNALSVSGHMEAVISLSRPSPIPWEWHAPYTNWIARYRGTNAIESAWEHADSDGDGAPNWTEFIRDTHPGRRDGTFTLVRGALTSRWEIAGCSTARVYGVYWTTNLLQSAWQYSSMTVTGPPWRVQWRPDPQRPRSFYRPSVRLPGN